MFEHKYDDFMQFYGDVCEDPRDPIERKLAVMKKRNIAFGGKGSAPDPNPGMLASAEAAKTTAAAQERIAQNTLNFYKQQYEEFKPSIQQMLQTELSIMGENKDRAAEYAAYEKSTFRPVEQALVDQAKNYNTEAKREELARTASSDVAQAFGNVREQQNRQLAAAGIRPNSGRFAALNQTMLTQEALARAGAQNSARSMAEDKGQGGRQSAMAGGQIMGQGFQGAINANNGAIGGYGAAGNIYGQEFNARMQGYNAQQEAAGAFYGGLGQIGGMALGAYFKADGGEIRRGLRLADGAHVGPGPVRGPGGPVDDKIPAMLSNGEYVIPADTAAKIGKKNLDKLVAETHTPAAVQRQRKRKALKGKK